MPTGRPREFDLDERLDRAMRVFWRLGYEGAGMAELTEAMGISRPSLYAAYGNKEELFRKAVERYAAGPARHVDEALREPTARAAAERLLRGAAEVTTSPDNPSAGCLIVQGALATGTAAAGPRAELAARRRETEELLRERFERAREEGELPSDADLADLARYVTTVAYGLSVQAADGATRADLLRTVDTALRCWPTA
ncbi:TetR/AcrR family transcriptional regulator [Streptomyces sp. NPDC089919]|uniref:TetR/AcrR family transcriptional regulator n=1 Tax=Streptomyces sp. NPDC089919 TaxID=3155188 RepID=UPI003414EAF6